jgi:hypothetical protein
MVSSFWWKLGCWKGGICRGGDLESLKEVAAQAVIVMLRILNIAGKYQRQH